MFERIISADWSTSPKKRWIAEAERNAGGWIVSPPVAIHDMVAFTDDVFRGPRIIVGFDFPIGVPRAFGEKTDFADFLDALESFGREPWERFYDVADTADEISLHRPFYPRVSRKGSSPSHLIEALGFASSDQLRRRCEMATSARQAGCPLFWTLGGNQVGKAALSGWREFITPARVRGAKLWPFDGSLSALANYGHPVLAEIYPGEAYGHLGISMRGGKSKRKQADRAECAPIIKKWAARNSVAFSEEMNALLDDGFGSRSTGEDAFDAAMGLFGMIEVVSGRRAEAPAMEFDKWEGWILGQTDTPPN